MFSNLSQFVKKANTRFFSLESIKKTKFNKFYPIISKNFSVISNLTPEAKVKYFFLKYIF